MAILKSIDWTILRPRLIRVATFIVVALVVSFLIPIKRSSRYQYVLEKPWQGELLTAPYEFPIYKSEEQLKREQDSIRKEQLPIYRYQKDVGLLILEELKNDYTTRLSATIPSEYFAYAYDLLSKAYEDGIISINDQKALRSEEKLEVLLLNDEHEQERIPSTRLRTLKEVHEQALQELPPHLEKLLLQQLNIEHYLKENISLDEERTERFVQEAISNISPSIGMVQPGQRIIDKGEIVSPYTYTLLRSLEREEEQRAGSKLESYKTRIGLFIIISITFALLALYLGNIIRSYTPSIKNNGLILSVIFIFVLLTAIVSYWGFFDVYMIPYVMIVILLRIFLDSYTSLLSFTTSIVICALFVVDPLNFIIIQFLAGLVALVGLNKMTSRGKMIRAAFMVYVAYIILYFSTALIRGEELTDHHWSIFLVFGINLIFLNFTYLLSALVERSFGYVSNVSLVELSDINSPLLKELSEVAPGTFQHSLQVSILAADAADRIGGDVQLIRTGALYHDIGKMKNPAYFTENQGGLNPHDLLSQAESAAIIIRHVTDGIALAQKHDLPTQIIDFIRTHHSTSLVRYFYNSYCNEHPDEEVDIELFSYAGPKPFTREQGILMLADATEASSRSLKQYSAEHIAQHVHRIVDGIISEGHLNDTPLSFRDIQTIKEVFISKLQTIYHTRISYPERKV